MPFQIALAQGNVLFLATSFPVPLFSMHYASMINHEGQAEDYRRMPSPRPVEA